MEGWIKIHRKMLDWEWYNDNNTKVLFLHLLLTANHKDKKWQGKTILRGQKITSLQHLAEETYLTIKQVRTALKKLKETNEITVKGTSQYSLITIEKYNDYQINEEEEGKQGASEGQAKGKQRATNKNDKNDKNILYYGEYKNVFFTNEQYQKLLNEFPNDYKDRIQRLDDYIQSNGLKNKYKDCLATIRCWARKEGYIKPSEQKKETYVENTMSVEEYFAKLKGVKSV